MSQLTGTLVIVRHGESTWNARGVWTGTTDVPLSMKGHHEAEQMGRALKGFKFDLAIVSEQVRTHETLDGILVAAGQPDVPRIQSGAINERDYGDLTGKNKWEVKAEIGEEAFQGIRRGWDYPVPNGETLKQVYERSVPFYLDIVVPELRAGKTVLIAAHGNSIRSLVKYLDDIPDDKIAGVEMIFGTALVYRVDERGKQVSKEILKIDTTLPPA